MAEAEFYVEGLTQFRTALTRMSDTLPKSLRDYNVTAANKIISEAKTRAGARAQSAKAAKSLRASRAASYVGIRLGDNGRYAFARGAEWGARRYAQFPPWRGNQWRSWDGGPGYFLHPAIRDVGQDVLEDYWLSIRSLIKEAFPA